MLCQQGLFGEHFQAAIQTDPYSHSLPDELDRDSVAVAAHLHIGIPIYQTTFPMGRIDGDGRDPTEMWLFLLKTDHHHCFDDAMHTLVGLVLQPMLAQLVEMDPTFKLTIAHKEVVLDIVHHPLGSDFGESSEFPPKK